MTRQQLDSLRVLAQRQTGISIPPGKDYLLEARIAKLLRAAGLGDPGELIAGLERGDALLCEMLAYHVTTCHTYFMREAEHFELAVREIRRRQMPEVAIWVAAAASGEEVYSIAITLLMAGISRFRIMASDINRQNLVTLKRGVYPASRLGTLPIRIRDRYFNQWSNGSDGQPEYQACEELRSRIAVRRLNLMDLLRFEQPFDFIFCRNVFMYFSQAIQARVLGMLLENLGADGVLFMGQTENLLGLSAHLTSMGPGVFRRRTGNGQEARTDHR